MELAETTDNMWAKQNALFAYNRVMEISERFSYHSQILENMVASGQQGRSQESGMGLSRVPVSSVTTTEGVSSSPMETGVNGELRVDGASRGLRGGSGGASPDLSEGDDHIDSGANELALRYIHVTPTLTHMDLYLILVVLNNSILYPTGLFVHARQRLRESST